MVDDYLMELSKPLVFNADSKENAFIDIDLSFENLCSALEDAGVSDPKNKTKFEFEQRISHHEKKKPPKIR